MTRLGLYTDHNKNHHRVLFTARMATPGNPDEGKVVVVYVDLKYGGFHVCDETKFNEKLPAPPELGFKPGVEVERFMFYSSGVAMTDADAVELYDSLHETFTGRKPAP